jgi:subtilisin family serine protease
MIMPDARPTSLRNLLIISLIGGILVASAAAFATSDPGDIGFVFQKNSPVISPWAASLIDLQADAGRVKVWVYFTDKGFTDKAGMAATASRKGVTLTARAQKRRAKVGRSTLEFTDMPVHQAYVDGVIANGGELRHLSRWLNAASFEIDRDQIGTIAAMDYVRKIGPVMGYEREPVKTGPPLPAGESTERKSSSRSPSVLDYGASLAQLTQLNVIAMHDLGFTGQGVLVCMTDTGYRKDHVAFQEAYLDGRVLAERDFIFNDEDTQDEPEDLPGQHNHGTYCWSALGGEADGSLYGPAFGASFILAKTEDTRSETEVEEDNWLAAVEWADSIGADVISSSLVYKDWYVYADYNGDFCVTTNAADMAASLGIVVCNAMGNYGSGSPTLGAPADADSIISCGAVSSAGVIAGFSSSGPTSDGRTKPEVCARGLSTACANASSTTSFGTASGTSLSTPLVGGCAAVLLSAHPDWTPMEVREALMMTASQSSTPDNIYGWGIIDLLAAYNYDGSPSYIPGDLNYDEAIDVVDLTELINIVFSGASFPPPPVSPDLNLDGTPSAPDIVMMIDYIYRGGAAPPYPTT